MVSWDVDIPPLSLVFLIKTYPEKNVAKFYELKAISFEEATLISSKFKNFIGATLNFLEVEQNEKFCKINLRLNETNLNISITCKSFEWNFVKEEELIIN